MLAVQYFVQLFQMKLVLSVSTIEHLMGALYGLGIDNALIEIDNQEVPILDGSAKVFVEAIYKIGIKNSNAPIKIVKIKKKIEFEMVIKHQSLLNQVKLA